MLISLDFHTEQSLEFTLNGVKIQNLPSSSSCLGQKRLTRRHENQKKAMVFKINRLYSINGFCQTNTIVIYPGL